MANQYEGVALLQGRAVCGRCGQHMRVRYRDARGRLESLYVCDRATDARAEPNCQSLAGTAIDEAVGRRSTAAAGIDSRTELQSCANHANKIKVLISNRRRCSMKTVGCEKG